MSTSFSSCRRQHPNLAAAEMVQALDGLLADREPRAYPRMSLRASADTRALPLRRGREARLVEHQRGDARRIHLDASIRLDETALDQRVFAQDFQFLCGDWRV